jgi:cysteinyl-tRNA synthetase
LRGAHRGQLPFLGSWDGNDSVRYRHAGWQTIFLGALDRILAAGFDGLYLDIVDGIEFFE